MKASHHVMAAIEVDPTSPDPEGTWQDPSNLIGCGMLQMQVRWLILE
jgi:hypothetical protein